MRSAIRAQSTRIAQRTHVTAVRANALIDNDNAASGDLRAIIPDTRAGRGTIGGLLIDPSI